MGEGMGGDRCEVCGGDHPTSEHVDDAAIGKALREVANAPAASKDKEPHALVGQAFAVAAQVRAAVGKHGHKYKARLVAALKDEKDPLYTVLRQAAKRVAGKVILGD